MLLLCCYFLAFPPPSTSTAIHTALIQPSSTIPIQPSQPISPIHSPSLLPLDYLSIYLTDHRSIYLPPSLLLRHTSTDILQSLSLFFLSLPLSLPLSPLPHIRRPLPPPVIHVDLDLSTTTVSPPSPSIPQRPHTPFPISRPFQPLTHLPSVSSAWRPLLSSSLSNARRAAVPRG